MVGTEYGRMIPRYLERLERPETPHIIRREGIIDEVTSEYVMLTESAEDLPTFTIPLPFDMREGNPKTIETIEQATPEIKLLASREHPLRVYHREKVVGVYTRGPSFQPRSIEMREIERLADIARNLATSTRVISSYNP
ncbi:hypothetical protein JW826_04695 [Candidatus Woesearchaeota archaeon]|nr:hypothetical protein [Candidatus Woesearchaeota archaeon]